MPRFDRRRSKPSVITLADRARDVGQWEIAAGYYREALQRKPQNPPIWVQYGHVLKESGQLAEAERAYRTALAYDPHTPDTHLHLGHVLKIQGKKNEARAAYLRGFVLDPSPNGASVELARIGWQEAHFSELRRILGTDTYSPSPLTFTARAKPGALASQTADDQPILDRPVTTTLDETFDPNGMMKSADVPKEVHGSTWCGPPLRRFSNKFRLVYVSGEPETPGHQYRVVRPMAAAAVLDAETTWMRVEEIPTRFAEIEEADSVIFWRTPWDDRVALGIDTARRNGTKIVFDVDDLMIDPKLARIETIDGIRTNNLSEVLVRSHFERLRATMAAADLCTATTAELAMHMRNAFKPAMVLPNGFDHATLAVSRLADRRRLVKNSNDGLVRIGYASGSRTHQHDFAACADAIAEILREHPECRLVTFRSADGSSAILDVEEFPSLRGLEHKIEWRNFVPLEQLPDEVARFDINLVPLEVGNPFCEAKSELKFFESALAGVPTIASPTGPFVRAMRHGETGFLAKTPGEWHGALTKLVGDPILRSQISAAARRDVLWPFGPERRTQSMGLLIDLLRGGQTAAHAFALDALLRRVPQATPPRVPDHKVIFDVDHLGTPQVTVVVPLYNYVDFVGEALDSVAAQTLRELDLIVVDDCSTDGSLSAALGWAKANASRLNRICILLNRVNSGLALTRNVGFDAAETPFVLPLDADNRLFPACAAACLDSIRKSGAAFAYPLIKAFGASEYLMGLSEYDPIRLADGNYIDAMALVSKAVWAAVGGYDHLRFGWEDFDFWCKLAEQGLRGERVPGGPFAEYRVHSRSMIQTANTRPETIRVLIDQVEKRHPWLTLIWPLADSSVETSYAGRCQPQNDHRNSQPNMETSVMPVLAHNPEAEVESAKFAVPPQIHADDFLFRFHLDAHPEPDKNKARRLVTEYYFLDGDRSAAQLDDLVGQHHPAAASRRLSLFEFASGYGCVSRHLRKRNDRYDLIACDIHPQAIKFLREELRVNALLSCTDPKDFDAKRKFDIVFALSFFSHMPDGTFGTWIRVLFETLADDGLLIFTTHGLAGHGDVNRPVLEPQGYWFAAGSEQKDIPADEYGCMIATPFYVMNQIARCPCAAVVLFQEAFWWRKQDLFIVRKVGTDFRPLGPAALI